MSLLCALVFKALVVGAFCSQYGVTFLPLEFAVPSIVAASEVNWGNVATLIFCATARHSILHLFG